MALENILHMNVGSGEYSYANQSILQKAVILKARPYLEKNLMDMYRVDKFPACLKMADLGSSSGPNTLLSMSHIIVGVHAICHENEVKLPEFQVFFNDLPSNDFNNLFNLVPHYLYKKLKKKEEINCQPSYVNGVPGSFYERLFPSASLDIFHTSSTSQWLSQVPRRLESNKGNIYISNSSAPHIYEAYLKQFEQDLSTFLHLRSQEITSNGRMLITFCARRVEDPTSDDCCFLWNMLAKSLVDMQDKGVLCENDVNSFNIPMYFPSEGELKAIIEKEGSFKIESMDMFELNWDVRQDIDDKHFFGADKDSSGLFLSKIIRAGLEPLLVNHFGSRTYIGNIFESYAKHANQHLSTHKPKSVDIVVSFKKK